MARRSSQDRAREYIIVALLALGIIWMTSLIFGIARKEEIARHTVRDTQAELASLQERQDVLQGNINELDTPRGQEATLRQDFGVAKPGEEVIVVVPEKELPPPPPLPWWRKALNAIGL